MEQEKRVHFPEENIATVIGNGFKKKDLNKEITEILMRVLVIEQELELIQTEAAIESLELEKEYLENRYNNLKSFLMEKDIDRISYAKHFKELEDAVRWNNLESFKKLLGGAESMLNDPLIGSADRLLHIAVRNHNFTITELLLNHGALVNLENASGETPLSLALRSKNIEILILLLSKDVQTNGLSVLECNLVNSLKLLYRENVSVENIRNSFDVIGVANKQGVCIKPLSENNFLNAVREQLRLNAIDAEDFLRSLDESMQAVVTERQINNSFIQNVANILQVNINIFSDSIDRKFLYPNARTTLNLFTYFNNDSEYYFSVAEAYDVSSLFVDSSDYDSDDDSFCSCTSQVKEATTYPSVNFDDMQFWPPGEEPGKLVCAGFGSLVASGIDK